MRKILKEQDLSKIDWFDKHQRFFQYHNTFSGCRAAFTDLLKELVEYFGEDVTKEANQLIVSFKRGILKDYKANPNKKNPENIKKYLKPEFERIGIKWTKEDEEELAKSLENKEYWKTHKLEEKKKLVEDSLFDRIFEYDKGMRYPIYKTCVREYENAYHNWKNKVASDNQLQLDFTQISGDNKELQKKLSLALDRIKKLQKEIQKLKAGESPVIKKEKMR